MQINFGVFVRLLYTYIRLLCKDLSFIPIQSALSRLPVATQVDLTATNYALLMYLHTTSDLQRVFPGGTVLCML